MLFDWYTGPSLARFNVAGPNCRRGDAPPLAVYAWNVAILAHALFLARGKALPLACATRVLVGLADLASQICLGVLLRISPSTRDYSPGNVDLAAPRLAVMGDRPAALLVCEKAWLPGDVPSAELFRKKSRAIAKCLPASPLGFASASVSFSHARVRCARVVASSAARASPLRDEQCEQRATISSLRSRRCRRRLTPPTRPLRAGASRRNLHPCFDSHSLNAAAAPAQQSRWRRAPNLCECADFGDRMRRGEHGLFEVQGGGAAPAPLPRGGHRGHQLRRRPHRAPQIDERRGVRGVPGLPGGHEQRVRQVPRAEGGAARGVFGGAVSCSLLAAARLLRGVYL